jgi:hypothetical protein
MSGPADDPTRRLGDRSTDDPTRRLDGDSGAHDPTRRLERPGAPPADPRLREPAPEEEPRGRGGRDAVVGLIGVLLGVVLALVVVALGTRGPAADGDLAAAQQRATALEAELAERDAQIAELEARLAEAEAAAGARAEDVEAQRQALQERATALDDRAAGLDQRQAAVEERERRLAEREAAEQPGTPAAPDEPEGGGRPQIDVEEAQNAIERLLDRIRELFGADGE